MLWPVVSFVFSSCVTFLAVCVLIHNRTDGAIDGKLLPVDAESRKLRIKAGKTSSLYESMVGGSDARNDMASCESSLLGPSEIFINSNIPNRYEFLGPHHRSHRGCRSQSHVPVIPYSLFLDGLDDRFSCRE